MIKILNRLGHGTFYSKLEEMVLQFVCKNQEADTRLILDIQHAAKLDYKSVIEVANDKDVMILSLACVAQISCKVYMRCGSKNNIKLININKIASFLGKEEVSMHRQYVIQLVLS